jgi:hypothetical protein
VRHSPEGAFDLHVLGTPPTFILSQDQTLRIFLTEFLTVSSQPLFLSSAAPAFLPSHYPVVKLHPRAFTSARRICILANPIHTCQY